VFVSGNCSSLYLWEQIFVDRDSASPLAAFRMPRR
jgi:hypothetical protein